MLTPSVRNKQSREEMARAVASGKCRRCRKLNPDAGRRNECPGCRFEANATARRNRERRLAAGTCCQCDDPPLPGLTRCERHHAIQKVARVKSNKRNLSVPSLPASRTEDSPGLTRCSHPRLQPVRTCRHTVSGERDSLHSLS